MKKTLSILLSVLVLIPGGASASDAPLTALTGSAGFDAKERSYLGTYATTSKSLSIDIDGVNYKGNYVPLAEDITGPSNGAQAGSWGRAFLFASSAKVLRCQLDAGFPKVSGQCEDAGGRIFQLKPGVAQQTVASP